MARNTAKVRNYKGKSKGAQEAHEAIRPTNITNTSPSLERDQSKLYELIWKRTIASQMSDAQLERTNVKIKANTHNEEFTANGEVIKFDGFLKVYLESSDEEDTPEEQDGRLPAMKVGETPVEQSYYGLPSALPARPIVLRKLPL